MPSRPAALYRMVLPDHTCPHGVRAKALLENAGFTIEEHILATREEVDTFKREQGVETTPQIFVDGDRIGGASELEQWLAHA